MTRKFTPLAALAVFGATLLLSGCGNGVTSSPARTPAGKATGGSAAVSLPLEYSECMRDHGVPKFPDPVDGRIVLNPASGIDPDSPTVQAASAACAKYAPPGSSPDAAAAATPATWRAFAASLKADATAGRFTGAVLVARNGRAVLDAGYGFADRATRAANTPETRFCIASIGKLFTAVAIGQLAEHGKLSFDASVGRLPDRTSPRPIADHVTIAELLDMTAGLGNVALGGPTRPARSPA